MDDEVQSTPIQNGSPQVRDGRVSRDALSQTPTNELTRVGQTVTVSYV